MLRAVWGVRAGHRVDRKEKWAGNYYYIFKKYFENRYSSKKKLPITLSNMLRAGLEVECMEHRMEERDQEQVIIHFQEDTLNTDIFG